MADQGHGVDMNQVQQVSAQLQQAYIMQVAEALNKRVTYTMLSTLCTFVTCNLVMVYKYMVCVQLSTTCFKTCVSKPSSTMKSSEKKCVGRCVDRWLEGMQVITKTLTASDTSGTDFANMDEGVLGFDDSLLKAPSGDDEWWSKSSRT